MRFAIAMVLLAGCGKGDADGLPPATEWNDDPTAGAVLPDQPRAANPHGEATDDPHRDVPGAPPLTGNEPSPHDFDDFAADPQMPDEPSHAEPAVAPNPATRVRGTLKLDPKLASRVKTGGVIYLIAKAADAAGKPTGTALAIDRLTWTADGQAFELGGASGEVLVIARYDQDGEGMSGQPGDVIGMTKVKVPADNVVIQMSTLVE
jgi:hypothetical protein